MLSLALFVYAVSVDECCSLFWLTFQVHVNDRRLSKNHLCSSLTSCDANRDRSQFWASSFFSNKKRLFDMGCVFMRYLLHYIQFIGVWIWAKNIACCVDDYYHSFAIWIISRINGCTLVMKCLHTKIKLSLMLFKKQCAK